MLPGRCLFAVPLVLVLSTSFVFAQENVIELTNADVLAMVKSKLPADAIITKIQNSLCHFDTFPPVMAELRYRGVPEDVLVAMVAAPIGRPRKLTERTSSNKPDTTKGETLTSKPKLDSLKTTKSNPSESAGTRAVSDAPREKTRVEKVTSSGKATLPSVKLTTTAAAPAATIRPTTNTITAPVPPAQKQNSIYATLPLPEPVKLESAISTSPKPIVNDSAPIQIASTNAVASVPAISQPKPTEQPATSRTLTNSDVIKLLRGGSSTTAVVDAIKAAPGNYDLSAKALLELRDAGADASVFLSMMETNQKAIENKNAVPTTRASVPSKP